LAGTLIASINPKRWCSLYCKSVIKIYRTSGGPHVVKFGESRKRSSCSSPKIKITMDTRIEYFEYKGLNIAFFSPGISDLIWVRMEDTI
jgi:hypothetical protein